MNRESAWNMFVFRDGRRCVPGATLARALTNAIRSASECPEPRARGERVNALLLAGELECALSDENCAAAIDLARITDSLAQVSISGQSGAADSHNGFGCEGLTRLPSLVPEGLPQTLKISPPEGFAYYALHPLDFADLAMTVPLAGGWALVIGIRSIGATLSALVLAGLCQRGVRAERFTVRPSGHPYARRTDFSPEQLAIIQRFMLAGADFLVVDEGPGMSGSSFLSVGDALQEAGVAREKIVFLGSRLVDPENLRASNAAQRWREYCFYNAPKNSRLPLDAKIYIGGGEWRSCVYTNRDQWPSSWIQMERLKFLSGDRKLLYKFEGFGRFGSRVHQNSARIANAGFGPNPIDFVEGFGAYPMVPGEPLRREDLSSDLLDRMGEYCAFRVAEFRSADGQNSRDLERMVRFNVAEEFGQDILLEQGALHSEHPVLVDGRMLPQEWLRAGDGYMKVDGASHGDDHFFPGPSDIAWDLAGAIVEWNMTDDAAERLLNRYQRLSGDNARPRLPAFLLAYAIFRLGYCRMAAEAVGTPGEASRLLEAHRYYRMYVSTRLEQFQSQDQLAAD